MADTENTKKLRYEAELNPFTDFIEANYCESSQCVFRSTISDPPSEKDSIPQSKRTDIDRALELDMPFSQDEVEEMTDDEKREYVGSLAISVFRSKEKAQKNVIDMIRHIAKNFSQEEAMIYLQERRGPYLAKIQLSPDVGLLEKKFNKKGHANLLLYEGVDIKNYVQETYDPIRFEDIAKTNYKKDINGGNS